MSLTNFMNIRNKKFWHDSSSKFVKTKGLESRQKETLRVIVKWMALFYVGYILSIGWRVVECKRKIKSKVFNSYFTKYSHEFNQVYNRVDLLLIDLKII